LSDKHPLRNRVLGGLIVALLIWLATFIPAVWHACKSASIWLFHFLLSSVPIPIWLILLISPIIIFILIKVVTTLRKESGEHLNWRDYDKDEILGMNWRWRYSLSNGSIENIWCFCPFDNTRLVYEDWYSKIYFVCETCEKRFGPFKGDLNYNISRAKRQIERKLTNNEWKAVVERLG
jgi:hypothetical protein